MRPTDPTDTTSSPAAEESQTTPTADEGVRAAGGVILRDGRVLVVHRARYDDWSLPKGKLEPGESWEAAALREMHEETGLVCELGAEVGRSHYVDARGRPKEVRFFAMSTRGEPAAGNEVDEVAWLELADAANGLSYRSDRELLAPLVASRASRGVAVAGAGTEPAGP